MTAAPRSICGPACICGSTPEPRLRSTASKTPRCRGARSTWTRGRTLHRVPRRFVLDTPAGDVRHLGTQYEARLDDGGLRVGIREGRVEVSGRRASVVGSAGEVLALRDGQVTRSALAPNASAWNWVTDVTPPFSIDGRTVEEFLTWAGRETGRRVVYASPEVERLARSVTLNGTVDGLPPQQAVAAVLATTSLETTVVDGSIEVGHARH